MAATKRGPVTEKGITVTARINRTSAWHLPPLLPPTPSLSSFFLLLFLPSSSSSSSSLLLLLLHLFLPSPSSSPICRAEGGTGLGELGPGLAPVDSLWREGRRRWVPTATDRGGEGRRPGQGSSAEARSGCWPIVEGRGRRPGRDGELGRGRPDRRPAARGRRRARLGVSTKASRQSTLGYAHGSSLSVDGAQTTNSMVTQDTDKLFI